ncbi:hypothetical protein NPIL_582141 [Nephila pilipes]|uniref:Uncharacterized protein n=1 Tax=Nephila pilipes TaxID=299642 RepID=A0A8X6N941_NEPPI|nr:hypothetical protein NPIL_582141 [Nephila pilipes]
MNLSSFYTASDRMWEELGLPKFGIGNGKGHGALWDWDHEGISAPLSNIAHERGATMILVYVLDGFGRGPPIRSIEHETVCERVSEVPNAHHHQSLSV